MKVRITADGSARGTKVTDLDGNLVEGVTEVAFRHQAGGGPAISLGILLCPVVIEGDAKVCGANGKVVKTIIYEDGERVDY